MTLSQIGNIAMTLCVLSCLVVYFIKILIRRRRGEFTSGKDGIIEVVYDKTMLIGLVCLMVGVLLAGSWVVFCVEG